MLGSQAPALIGRIGHGLKNYPGIAYFVPSLTKKKSFMLSTPGRGESSSEVGILERRATESRKSTPGVCLRRLNRLQF
jgi:hypothetical protein